MAFAKKHKERDLPPLPEEIESTKEVKIPKDLLEQVIGQDNAVRKVRLAIEQRRHLLFVGPPGVGKSMLAQGLAAHLKKPTQQINILHDPKNPRKPTAEIVTQEVKENLVEPRDVPAFVAEQMGFKCPTCGEFSSPKEDLCKKCGADKFDHITKKDYLETTTFGADGRELDVAYEKVKNKIRVVDHGTSKLKPDLGAKEKRFVLVPLKRKSFVHATGASEVELLGDVRHDPYGMHAEIGTPAYLRIEPGAIHEAHEGVLFIDELPHLDHLQNFILTAMQEKKFSITGRNPQSSGASVKVEDVPCDFTFVGACNIRDVADILPPLRSRILGNGYEILLETNIPDTTKNQRLMVQFIAQEIIKDKKIPHATGEAVLEILKESRKRARVIDDARNSLTLRLRDIGGIIRLAGDLAKDEGFKLIEKKHILAAIEEAKPIEYQLQERYGSVWKGIEKDEVVNPEYGKTGSSYL
ncbi:MAG: ATP-binding protein [Candidatus Altiarchaeota archaeon]